MGDQHFIKINLFHKSSLKVLSLPDVLKVGVTHTHTPYDLSLLSLTVRPMVSNVLVKGARIHAHDTLMCPSLLNNSNHSVLVGNRACASLKRVL